MIQYLKCVQPKNTPRFQNLICFGSKYIYQTVKTGKLAKILDKRANQLIRDAALVCLALLVASITFAIYPFYLFITEGAYPMPIPVILPFTNLENNTGYALILANQVFIVFAGLTGNFCIEIWFSIIVNNLWAATDVIQYSLDEIAIGVERNETLTIRKFKLRNVLVQIQDLDR